MAEPPPEATVALGESQTAKRSGIWLSIDFFMFHRAKALHAVHDPADGVVSQALVRHFTDYAVAFIRDCAHPDLPDANRDVIAQFVAHGFAGAIKAWLSNRSVAKDDLVDAVMACAPAWWR